MGVAKRKRKRRKKVDMALVKPLMGIQAVITDHADLDVNEKSCMMILSRMDLDLKKAVAEKTIKVKRMKGKNHGIRNLQNQTNPMAKRKKKKENRPPPKKKKKKKKKK